MLKESVAGLRTVAGCSANAAASVAKYLWSKSSAGVWFYLAPCDLKSIFFRRFGRRCSLRGFLLGEVNRDVIVTAEGDLEADESGSDVRPFGSFEIALVPSSVRGKASSAVFEDVKRATAVDKLPQTWKEPTPASGNI